MFSSLASNGSSQQLSCFCIAANPGQSNKASEDIYSTDALRLYICGLVAVPMSRGHRLAGNTRSVSRTTETACSPDRLHDLNSLLQAQFYSFPKRHAKLQRKKKTPGNPLLHLLLPWSTFYIFTFAPDTLHCRAQNLHTLFDLGFCDDQRWYEPQCVCST